MSCDTQVFKAYFKKFIVFRFQCTYIVYVSHLFQQNLTLLEDEDKTVEGYGIEDMQQILLEGNGLVFLSTLNFCKRKYLKNFASTLNYEQVIRKSYFLTIIYLEELGFFFSCMSI